MRLGWLGILSTILSRGVAQDPGPAGVPPVGVPAAGGATGAGIQLDISSDGACVPFVVVEAWLILECGIRQFRRAADADELW